jgi:hypothetical protein
MERNKQHFHQAFDALFGRGVNDGILADLVGYSSLITAAKVLVDGTFMEKHGDKVDLLPKMKQLIIKMAMPEDIRNMGKIDCEFTMLGEMTRTKDGCSKNLTHTRNIPPKCNKQVTTKQQTRFSLTSIN